MSNFILIIIIIAGVLQIVLFFKVWVMQMMSEKLERKWMRILK